MCDRASSSTRAARPIKGLLTKAGRAALADVERSAAGRQFIEDTPHHHVSG